MLNELVEILSPILPTETSVFKGENADKYAVLTPLNDWFTMFADNKAEFIKEECRISLYIKGNYLAIKNKVIKLLLETDLDITEMKYIGLENDTGYHHYSIDVEKLKKVEEM